MAAPHVTLPSIENAIREVSSALAENELQTTSWERLAEDDLWREIVACILGSRIRFEVANAALERLEEMRLLSHSRRVSHFDRYEKDLKDALSSRTPAKGKLPQSGSFPFFRTRASQIRKAAERLYSENGSIRTFLENVRDAQEARRRLASEVSGLGPKQASLFLRNIGYADRIAILDVHVLTYMNWMGLTDSPLKAISTMRKYENLEDTFIKHACSCGCAPDRFDLAVWVVVRIVKKEFTTWE